MWSGQIVAVILTTVGDHISNSCNSISNDPICEKFKVLCTSVFNQDWGMMQNNELEVFILGPSFLQ